MVLFLPGLLGRRSILPFVLDGNSPRNQPALPGRGVTLPPLCRDVGAVKKGHPSRPGVLGSSL